MFHANPLNTENDLISKYFFSNLDYNSDYIKYLLLAINTQLIFFFIHFLTLYEMLGDTTKKLFYISKSCLVNPELWSILNLYDVSLIDERNQTSDSNQMQRNMFPHKPVICPVNIHILILRCQTE